MREKKTASSYRSNSLHILNPAGSVRRLVTCSFVCSWRTNERVSRRSRKPAVHSCDFCKGLFLHSKFNMNVLELLFVCVRERKKERGKEGERERERDCHIL